MNVVYISGPYRNDDKRIERKNIDAAFRMGIYWWEQGFAAIVPHKNSGGMENYLDVDEDILPGDEELVRRSDVVVLLPGWRQSAGSKREYEAALANNVPVLEWHKSEGFRLLFYGSAEAISDVVEGYVRYVQVRDGKIYREEEELVL